MSKATEQQINLATVNATEKTVTFETGLKRGDQIINSIIIRKPNVGALRGLSLQDILKWDVNAMTKLITRISSPNLTEAEINSLDIPDYTDINVAVTDFLASANLKSQVALTM